MSGLVTEFQLSELGAIGAELGSGGQAVVHDLPSFRIPGLDLPLVYKCYKTGPAKNPPDRAALGRLITLRINLPLASRERLDAMSTWPLALVVDGSVLRGVLMQRIPDGFIQDVVSPSGTPGRWVREVQYLYSAPDRSRRIGMPTPDDAERITICRDMADALAFLHSPGVDAVFGDLSAKNEVFRLDERPAVMLVDCDAIRVRGTQGAQPNTPDWMPPDPYEPLSMLTDRFKLGLFILRALGPPGPQTSTCADPSAAANVLDATGVDMLEKALSPDRVARPTPTEWSRYLDRLLGVAVDPPVLVSVAVDRSLVASGEPVTISWRATDAETITVTSPGCPPTVIDGRAGGGTIAVRPVRTGTLRVMATNPLGEHGATTDPVFVTDFPDLRDLPVPVPRMDLTGVGRVALPQLGTVLPPLPATATPVYGDAPPLPFAPPLPAAAGAVYPDASAYGPPVRRNPTDPPPAFDAGSTAFPIDLVSIVTDEPDRIIGRPTNGKAVR